MKGDRVEEVFEPLEPPRRMAQIFSGIESLQLLHVAAKLGIADLLAEGPKSAEELAAATGAHTRSLHRVLRALAAERIFVEASDGRFELNAESAALRTGARGSLRAHALMTGEPWYWNMHGHLLHTVMTGENAFEHLYSKPVYEYLDEHPESGKIFSDYMDEVSRIQAPWIYRAYDFSRFGTVVEVGGGRASLMILLLEAHQQIRGILYDRPNVVAGTRAVLEAHGLASRCSFVGGDFLESVPEGGDLYVVRNVIHDWDDARASILLKNCRKVMASEARLLVIEALRSDGPATMQDRYSDIQILAGASGCQRTAADFQALLGETGFELLGIGPTGLEVSVIEARPR